MVPTSWTNASAWSIINVSLDDAVATTGFEANDYSWVTSPQIVIQQKTDDAALNEAWIGEAALENTLTNDFVTESGKVAEMQGIVDIKLIYLDWSGNSTVLSGVHFSDPVKIMIPVTALSGIEVRADHEDGNGYGTTWLTLKSNASCNSDGSVATADAYTGWDVPVSGGKAEFYTCSASSFVAYTETTPAAPAPSTLWGGGWGGSSSYSCKSLPANAVANNNTKPNKTISYSYSTDTTKVCTFQCKTWYTWNETAGECQASESTTTTGDNTLISPNETEEDNNNTPNIGDTSGQDPELVSAYEWAYGKWITTMPTFEAARLDDGITRWEMAKMMVVFASKVLGKQPVKTDNPKYWDVSEQAWWDLAGYMNLAYQYQIMGINANGTPLRYFNPDGKVSRAEFATVLSRVLFGSTYNQSGDNYYERHIQALFEAWILKNTDPTIQELRWWILLMLYRSQNQ